MKLAVYGGDPADGSFDEYAWPGEIAQRVGSSDGLLVLDPLSFPFEILRGALLDRPIVVIIDRDVSALDRSALAGRLQVLGPGDGLAGADVAGPDAIDDDPASAMDALVRLVESDAGWRKRRRRAEAAALRWVLHHESRALGVTSVHDVDGSVAALGWPPADLDLDGRHASLVAAVRPAASLAELRVLAGPGGRVVRLLDEPADLEEATLIRSVRVDPPSIVVAVAS